MAQKLLTATTNTQMKVELDIALGMNPPATALGFQTTRELQELNMKPDSTKQMVAANLALWPLA